MLKNRSLQSFFFKNGNKTNVFKINDPAVRQDYILFQSARNSWPCLIQSKDELPAAYAEVFPDFNDDFPYTILIPEENYSFYKKRGILLTLINYKLYIFEKLGDVKGPYIFNLNEISWLENGMILLNSWIKLTTVNATFTINYNTVRNFLFNPIIDFIRNIPINQEISRKEFFLDEEIKKFNFLADLNYKFMNYGKDTVKQGQKVISLLYQPKNLYKYINFFHYNFLARYVSAHLTILTDEELILIKDDSTFQRFKDREYGAIFTYIPLKNITRVIVDENWQDKLVTLTFQINNHNSITSYFSKENKEVNNFITKINQLI